MSAPLLPLREDMTRPSPNWLRPFKLRNFDALVPSVASWTTWILPRTWPSRITAFLFLLLPSFIQILLRPGPSKARHLYPTSWLDGLRGIAAFIVFIWHFTVHRFGGGWYHWPYGVHDENDHVPSSPLQLPFLRIIYAGPAMVHVFFVVSGFALSYKPLKYVRKHDYDGLHRTLSSSIFRRGLRLFLPILALIMSLTMLFHLGGPFEALHVQRQPTLGAQLRDWFAAMWFISNGWEWDVSRPQPYDDALWTISIEFANSLLLYVVLTGLSRLKTYLRLALLFGTVIYCIKSGHWASFEFLAGMGLAEIDLIQDARRERAAMVAEALQDAGEEGSCSAESKSSLRSGTNWPITVFFVGNLVMGLFVAGSPWIAIDRAPGLSTLWSNTIEPFLSTGQMTNFWHAVAATQIVAATQQLKLVQAIFVTPLAQYLGDISYSLYLVHGSVLMVTAPLYLPSLWHSVGGLQEAGYWGRMFVWFIGWVVAAVPAVWAADVFSRAVDTKSIEFARRVEAICTGE